MSAVWLTKQQTASSKLTHFKFVKQKKLKGLDQALTGVQNIFSSALQNYDQNFSLFFFELQLVSDKNQRNQQGL